MKRGLLLLLTALSGAVFASDFAAYTDKSASIAEKWGWARGVVMWKYNPTNEPNNLQWGMLVQIQLAMQEWESVCGVKFRYAGVTYNSATQVAHDGQTVVAWKDDRPEYAGWAVAWLDRGRVREADVFFNSALTMNDWQWLQVALHEVGHMIGFPHSHREGNLMSGPPFTAYAWPGYITPDDVASCVWLYGLPRLEK